MPVVDPFTRAQISTTDATLTTLQTHTIPTNEAIGFTVDITAFEPATGLSGHWYQSVEYKNLAGVVTKVGSVVNLARVRQDADWSVTYTISGTNLLIQVTGEAGKTITWKGLVFTTPEDEDDPSVGNLISGTDLKRIFETDLTATELEYFIIPADLIIDQMLASSGYSTALLEQIELYLAAHFAASWSQRLTSQNFGDSAANFQHAKINTPLGSTDYGQRVMLLDVSGILASKLGKPDMKFSALGVSVDMTGINR